MGAPFKGWCDVEIALSREAELPANWPINHFQAPQRAEQEINHG
jgi:hypothetical protein